MSSILRQGLKFGLVGVLNTAIDASLYFLLTRYVGFFASRQVIAKAISYSAGVINSFALNRVWTFHSQVKPQRAFLPFYLANLVGVGLNASVMYLCFQLMRLPEMLSFLLATLITLVWNFTISKFVIFRQ